MSTIPDSEAVRRRWTFDRILAPFFNDRIVPAARYDSLCAFAPMWGIAATFSLAADRAMLLGHKGMFLFLLAWSALAVVLALLVRPRATWLLGALAALMLMIYARHLPVASNNKTISTVMNVSIIVVLATVWWNYRGKPDSREVAYERLRVIARSLLAIMYFYGIFHKINTDFLDPNVSCAVGLYRPLARPFGLDDNIIGRYLAIYATFVIEAIAIVSLYWQRYFAVGLIVALLFHYVIPISAYSWYMDFSSLVFALYMLTMPKQVSGQVHALVMQGLGPLKLRAGRLAVPLAGAALLAAAMVVVTIVSLKYSGRANALVYHSAWILVWAVVGGGLMVVMTAAALQHLPYTGPSAPPQPLWLYGIPGLFFLSCLSPYVGLKTESSINMFSNLHTEGGQSNHLLMPKPPYLFNYQRDVVRLIDSSDPFLKKQAKNEQWMVLFALHEMMRRHPKVWVTYEKNGTVYERVTGADLAGPRASMIERRLLIFKPVDFRRPKVCTH